VLPLAVDLVSLLSNVEKERLTMNMNQAIENLLTAIKDDYRVGRWTDQMIERFENGLEVQEGRKYIKVMTGNSVWGFIVKGEDKKFQVGDILKAASWATPTRNAARGNVFGDYEVRWTGPNYLR
jgi:nucleoside diphosphate kinase